MSTTPPAELEVVDQWPNSDGWWWCRSRGPNYQPGDELCVEVMMPGPYNGFVILWRGEEADLSQFAGMEWVKAESPFKRG